MHALCADPEFFPGWSEGEFCVPGVWGVGVGESMVIFQGEGA